MTQKLLSLFLDFLLLFMELSMLFIIISTLSDFLNHRYKKFFQKQLKSTSLYSYLKAIFLGSITPFCSCSTIPLLRAFLKSGIPLGVCSAYLLTSPLINPIIITLLFLTFGFKLTGAYIGFLVFCIFFISLLISKLNPSSLLLSSFTSYQTCCTNKWSDQPSFTSTLSPSFLLKFQTPQVLRDKKNLIYFLKNSLIEYKKLLPYIAIGMGIGSGIHGFIPQEFLQNTLREYGALSIILAAFLGILLYIRASMIIPIGVVLIEGGVPSGAVMSFLIAGAGCSLPELILLKSIFKTKFLALFVSIVLCVAIGFGFFIEILGV
ncbi:permease [Helicobacter cholecystus]|uniref:permease n=1 Tax=Helicobacter cholecystus TaxID=45498 RepID=UPI002739EE0C|nr:permease [Helicobacter cholecystus]